MVPIGRGSPAALAARAAESIASIIAAAASWGSRVTTSLMPSSWVRRSSTSAVLSASLRRLSAASASRRVSSVRIRARSAGTDSSAASGSTTASTVATTCGSRSGPQRLISSVIARARDQDSSPSARAAHVSRSRWARVRAVARKRVASPREKLLISATSSGRNSE